MEAELLFHEISLNDRQWMTEKFAEDSQEACEYTFVNNYIWRKAYQVEVAQMEGCGVIRYRESGNYRYSYPFGKGDKKKVVQELREFCRKQGYQLILCPLTDKHRKELISCFPGVFEITSDRNDFDYIYLAEKLAALKGKKYHGKRNHIARFMDAEDWNYEPITEENLEECRRMENEWIAFKEDKWEEGIAEETEALQEAFDHYKELGLTGGLIRKAGQIVAFTIGEPLNEEMMVVHFEKAFPDLQGAYPMINQQFIQHEGIKYQYINREEDVGDPGLRKAKLSYYPEILLRKYVAKESRVVFANEEDLDQIRFIWKTCFKDEDAYIDLYLKNRFETENMMVIHQDGKPVSMASFLPALLKQGEEQIPVKYVYAVATLPQYRGKGYAGKILEHASHKYGQPLILQPAEEELETYYKKLGFLNYFAKDEWKGEWIAAERQQMADLQENELCGIAISPEEYQKIRDSHLEQEGYLYWDTPAIAYALQENEFCGGQARKIIDQEENREDLILYRVEDGILRIIETTLQGEDLKNQVQKLLRKCGVNQAVYRNPGGMIKYPKQNADDQKISVPVRKTEDLKGYLNLTLG